MYVTVWLVEDEVVTNREYLNFTDMYNYAKSMLDCDYCTIDYCRNNCDNTTLNSFYIVGNIPEYLVSILRSKTSKLKLSMDSLLKNMLEHPEITCQEYMQLEYFLENAEYILLKNEKNLIYFKIDNCLYQFVIKNTKDCSENFLTTFHKASIKQLNKDISRYKQIKR